MRSEIATASLVAALVGVPGAAQAQGAPRPDALATAAPPRQGASHAAVAVESVPVADTAVRAARVSTEVMAPFGAAVAVVADVGRYREFLPQVRQTRVVRRRRGQADVYVQVPLLENLGVLWALTRFTFHRTPASFVVDGHAVSGNVARFDCRIEVAPGPTPDRARVTMQLLGLPRFPLPAALLTAQHARWAARGLAALKARVEDLAARRQRGSLGGGPGLR